MTKIWKKKSQAEINNTVFSALDKNIKYDDQGALGVPASYLDEKVFNQDAGFLKDAPYMFALVNNPNHIGCHTLGSSESFFRGTHEIERELIEVCAVDILKGDIGRQDGYVASGGTEANIQAIWIYRNYFMDVFSAKREQIAVICSEDSHYSMDKAANLLALDIRKIPVSDATREMDREGIRDSILKAREEGIGYFIVIANMMTTMYGSVDDVDLLTETLKELSCVFKLHVDGAYGGFYYPFTIERSPITFQNPDISSFTLDAHKMAQSPYGTGIFLIRKGMIQYANTQQASYVEGQDSTLIGSRSGANAIAVWMILMKNGPFGWQEKVFILQKRTEWLCKQLERLGVGYYRNPWSNIVTIRKGFLKEETVQKYGLVPDDHSNPEWFKVVVMEHVTVDKLAPLVDDIEKGLS